MSQITPQMVKTLREKTGAGMGDCKNALTEANGEMEGAIEILRKKGAATAAKRADRASNEGMIIARTSADGKTGIIVELNSETDFVARNEAFEQHINTIADSYLNSEASTHDDIMALAVGNDTILGLHNEILAKFSERIELRRYDKIKSEGYIAEYVHAGSKLAVLVEISAPNPNDAVKSMVRDITMQIAAMNPQYINRSQVTAETIAKEIEIYKELAEKEGKKPDIAERIATGRIEKFYQESCLMEQAFVKDSSKTIQDVVNEISKEMGTDVKINSFRRFFLGEV